MKRRFALLAATAIGTVGLLVPASPASATAGPDACAFTGNMHLSLGLGEVILSPANLVNFAFAFTVGVCLTKSSLTATGHLHGWCAHSTGSGITSNGASFHFINNGHFMVIFGHLVGVAHIEANIGTGSCLNKGATNFLVTGVVVLTPVFLIGLPPILWNQL